MKFAIIGLGKEGLSVGKEFMEQGHEIIGIDLDSERTERAKEVLPLVMKLGPTKKKELEKLPLSTIDYFILFIENEQENLLSSLLLKDLGQKEIWSYLTSDLQNYSLQTLGIHVFSKEDAKNPKDFVHQVFGKESHQ